MPKRYLAPSKFKISPSYPTLFLLAFTIALPSLNIFRSWQSLTVYSPFALLPFVSPLLLLQPSHPNFSPAVDYPTSEILQCLLLSCHFPLSYPNHICLFTSILADSPPAMHMHTFGSLLGLSFLFPSNSNVLLSSFKDLQINTPWLLFLLLPTAFFYYQCFTSSPFPPMSFT